MRSLTPSTVTSQNLFVDVVGTCLITPTIVVDVVDDDDDGGDDGDDGSDSGDDGVVRGDVVGFSVRDSNVRSGFDGGGSDLVVVVVGSATGVGVVGSGDGDARGVGVELVEEYAKMVGIVVVVFFETVFVVSASVGGHNMHPL